MVVNRVYKIVLVFSVGLQLGMFFVSEYLKGFERLLGSGFGES